MDKNQRTMDDYTTHEEVNENECSDTEIDDETDINIDARLKRIENMLAKLVTKYDLKTEMAKCITRDQLKFTVEQLTRKFELKLSEQKRIHGEELEKLDLLSRFSSSSP